MTPPPPSWRKGAAIALILLLILFWAGLVASLSPTVGRWPILVQAPFYLFMGTAWIIPLKPLIRWSQSGRFRAGPGSDN
ncbi:MAG: DUF2842 domain-containing protein [Pseudomonadota bacterium]|nr:DUF2842 domain-containing protein [Pseudomonadota bacterium]